MPAWQPKLSIVGVLQHDAVLRTGSTGNLHLVLVLAQPGLAAPLYVHQRVPASDAEAQARLRLQAANALAGRCVLLLGRGVAQADHVGHAAHAPAPQLQQLDRWTLVDASDYLTDDELAAPCATSPQPDMFSAAPAP